MRLLFITPDGNVQIEKTKISSRLLEMRDGYHPVNPDAIWHDDQRRRGSIMLVWCGFVNPEGSDLHREAIYDIQDECEIVKVGRKTQSISKLWMRRIGQILDGAMKYGVTIFLLILMGYALYMVLLGK